MRNVFRDQGLTIATLVLFLVFLIAQTLTGHGAYDTDQHEQQQQQPTVTSGAYLRTGHFAEATFENWKSEVL